MVPWEKTQPNGIRFDTLPLFVFSCIQLSFLATVARNQMSQSPQSKYMPPPLSAGKRANRPELSFFLNVLWLIENVMWHKTNHQECWDKSRLVPGIHWATSLKDESLWRLLERFQIEVLSNETTFILRFIFSRWRELHLLQVRKDLCVRELPGAPC